MEMRITQRMLSNNMLRNMNTSMSYLERLYEQNSTGKKVSKPSQDPVVAVRSLRLNSDIREIKQYERNLATAVKWLDTTDSVLQEVNSIFKTIVEKTTQGANGTLDQTSREAIAQELEQIKEHLGSIANTAVEGRYIFAGTDTDQKPYQGGNFVNTNTGKISVELGKGIFIDINVNGVDIFGYKAPSTAEVDPATGQPIAGTEKNIFEMLDSIVNTLRSENGDVDPYLDQIQDFEFHFLKVHSALGATKNRVDLIESRLADQRLATVDHLSREEDADLAEVIMNLNMQENVYRLSLASGARIIQPTLMDFLR